MTTDFGSFTAGAETGAQCLPRIAVARKPKEAKSMTAVAAQPAARK